MFRVLLLGFTAPTNPRRLCGNALTRLGTEHHGTRSATLDASQMPSMHSGGVFPGEGVLGFQRGTVYVLTDALFYHPASHGHEIPMLFLFAHLAYFTMFLDLERPPWIQIDPLPKRHKACNVRDFRI
jgi:hypothetical protein